VIPQKIFQEIKVMKHSIEKRDEAIQLRRAGKTAREISSQTGIGMTTLKGWFREEEINRLPKGKWRTEEEQKAIVNEYLESHSPKAIKESVESARRHCTVGRRIAQLSPELIPD
jgi:hypothetical protein